MKTRLFALLLGPLLMSAGASAHHSFAMFDHDQEVTLSGTVTEFEWTNPHTFIHLVVKDPKTGTDMAWAVEGSSPNTLKRRGWTRTAIKPGDKVTVILNPLRSGGSGGSLVKIAVEGREGPPLF